MAEREAFHDTAGDGEHVLDRPADFRAGHIVGIIGAERGPGDGRCKAFPLRPPALAGQRDGGGKTSGDFMREGRAGENGDGAARRGFARGIVHQAAGAGLDPLGAQHQIARGAGKAAKHAPQHLRRGDDQHGVDLREIAKIAGRADRRRKRG